MCDGHAELAYAHGHMCRFGKLNSHSEASEHPDFRVSDSSEAERCSANMQMLCVADFAISGRSLSDLHHGERGFTTSESQAALAAKRQRLSSERLCKEEFPVKRFQRRAATQDKP